MATSRVFISALSSRLRERLTEEAMTCMGLKEQVRDFLSDLESAHSLIVDADRRIHLGWVRLWVEILRGLVYQIEDALDYLAVEYAYRWRTRRREGFTFTDVLKRYCSIGELVARRRVALEVKSLTGSLSNLKIHLKRYGYQVHEPTENEALMEAYQRLQLSSNAHHLVKEDDWIFGFKGDLVQLVSVLLLNVNNEEAGGRRDRLVVPAVIGIWGLPASGKTTLAKLVYNHQEIRGSFQGFAWVTVSETTYRTIISVLGDTLVQLVPELNKEISQFEDITIAEKLFQVLKSKKCLIVLDDVSSSHVWETLRFAFAYQKTDSKVLVTTRNRDLARLMVGNDHHVYRMSSLSSEESWQLFAKRAFPNDIINQGNGGYVRVTNLLSMEEICQVLESRAEKELLEDRAFPNEIQGKDNDPHSTKKPSIEKICELLTDIAFRNENRDIINDLERSFKPILGRQIITECGGLPFVVITLGNFLASKSLREWKVVHKNIGSYLKSGEGSGIMKFLSMSYDDLPYHVRSCFSYLGTFPKNSEIEAETLYSLWMAEGIISEGEGKETVMEIGSRCLDAMASKRMVHVEIDEVPTSRKYKSCSLRNITHQFCLSKVDEDSCFFEVSLFEVMDLRHSNIINLNPSEGDCFPCLNWATRRLAVYLDLYEYDQAGYGNIDIELKRKLPSVMGKAYHLRSLLFINADDHHERYIFCPEELLNLEQFKLLRVLGFDGCSFQTRTLPKGIDKLLLLRYLSLRGCYVEELPSYIGNLSYLQTLDLRVTTSCNITIPDILWMLERLRHLYLPVAFQAKGDDDKLRFAGLRELQILKNFDPRVCHARDLFGLTNIRTLDATTSGNNEALKEMIGFMKKCTRRFSNTNMGELTLNVRNFDCYSSERRAIIKDLFSWESFRCSRFHSLSIDGHIEKLPEITCSGLTKLSLRGSQLVADPMPTLGKLPNLWLLVLSEAAFVGKEMVVSSESGLIFPELRELQLSGLHNLQKLTIENGAMPNLTSLEIERCKSLQVPQGLRHLPRLQELKIARMPKEFGYGLRILQEKRSCDLPELSIKVLDDSHKEQSAP